MKSKLYFGEIRRNMPISLTLLFLAFLFNACNDKVEFTREYTVFEPVYMSLDEIRKSVAVSEPQEIHNTGKLYLYGQYVLVNEPGEGIHLIDNSNPSAPNPINFIAIPGNYEMAIRDDILYVDSYIDLVALDISNPLAITELNRVEGIFRNSANLTMFDMEKGAIIDWEQVEKIDVTEGELGGFFPSFYTRNDGFVAIDAMAFAETGRSVSSFVAPTPVQTGIGGSMARFTIVGEYLYSIDNRNLQVFDLADKTNPLALSRQEVGWGIETIFPTEDKLFIGAQNGMYIYDNSNPASPSQLSMYQHVMSCDPVVVDGDIAFVTLRDGSACRGGFTNQLDVIDISNPRSPRNLISYPMTHPHGLGVDGDLLFICEGDFGLKIFDKKNVRKITSNVIMNSSEMHAFDVIPYQDNLLMIGDDGLYQYDYSDPENIRQLSVLSIVREDQ